MVPVQIEPGARVKEGAEENTGNYCLLGVGDKVKLLISKRCARVKGLYISKLSVMREYS